LLFAYSLGLAAPFLLSGIAFTRVMGTFRWLRNHYTLIRFAGGACLIAIGTLLFIDRFWWLQVGMNRALTSIGLGG
jgi:cytochrome c-type biogenesis protein